MTTPKPVAYPWRRVARGIFQGGVALAAIVPLIYQAATNHNPEAAGGLAAVALGISAAVTRVMALPVVEGFLAKYVPFLAATPPPS
jgi:hypothetical protein